MLAKADFERYAVRGLEPAACTCHGYTVISAPPPSSGGVILCEILDILEGCPLACLGAGSAETAHVMVEAMRHASARSRAAAPATTAH